jgi:hypothetical protein
MRWLEMSKHHEAHEEHEEENIFLRFDALSAIRSSCPSRPSW